MNKCPVCLAMGMDVKVDENEAMREGRTTDYLGKTFFFEDIEHKKMFDKKPGDYYKNRIQAS